MKKAQKTTPSRNIPDPTRLHGTAFVFTWGESGQTFTADQARRLVRQVQQARQAPIEARHRRAVTAALLVGAGAGIAGATLFFFAATGGRF